MGNFFFFWLIVFLVVSGRGCLGSTGNTLNFCQLQDIMDDQCVIHPALTKSPGQ